MIFGGQVAKQFKEANIIEDPSVICIGGDYEKLCLILEQTMLKLKEEIDIWKQRFFITAFGLEGLNSV